MSVRESLTDLREHICMRKVNDSKEMVVFDLELVPQGPNPENGATNKLEHKNTEHGRMHDMELTWRDVRRLRHGENKQDFGVRISAGELEDNVKIVGPRAGMVSGRVSGSIN